MINFRPPTRQGCLGLTAVAGVVTGLVVVTSSATAQSQQSATARDRGGVQLVLGAEEEFQIKDDSSTSTEAVTNLSFSLSSETRTAALKLEGVVGLRLFDDARSDGVDSEFGNSRVALSYALNTKSNRLRFNTSRTERGIDFLDPLIDFDPQDLFFDVSDLTGTGTRIDTRIGGSLSFGDDGPLGLTLSADRRALRYTDRPATDQTGGAVVSSVSDSTRTSVQARFRFDFTETTQGRLTLRHSVFEEEGVAEDRDTLALRAGMSIKRPNGSLGFAVEQAHTTEGTRVGADVSRSFNLPDSSLITRVGVTRSAAASDLFLTGGLEYTVERAQGRITASLTRSVSSTQSDSETVRTRASLTGIRALSPRLRANLGVDFAESKETVSRDSVKLATLRAGVDYALTPDWALEATLRHEIRDTSNSGRSSANILGVNLIRTFKIRY